MHVSNALRFFESNKANEPSPVAMFGYEPLKTLCFDGNSSDLRWFRWTCWKSTWIPFRMMQSWWLCYLPACVPRRAPDTTGYRHNLPIHRRRSANLAHPPAFCTGRASTRCSTRRSAHGFHHPRSTGETMHQSQMTQISKSVETHYDSLRHISQTGFQYLSVLAS